MMNMTTVTLSVVYSREITCAVDGAAELVMSRCQSAAVLKAHVGPPFLSCRVVSCRVVLHLGNKVAYC